MRTAAAIPCKPAAAPLLVLVCVLALGLAPPARADDQGTVVRIQSATQVRPEAAPAEPPPAAPPTAPPATPAPAPEAAPPEKPPAAERLLHVGLLLTPLSVTRPLAIDLFVRGPPLGLGFGYSTFPSALSATLLALAGANKGATTVSLERFDSWAGEGRLFPFLGAFYVAAAVGRQHLAGALTRTTDAGPETVHVDLISWYLAPRVGWLFRADSGFTLGAALGLQLTLSSSQQVTVPAAATDTIKKNLDSLAHFAAGLPLPELQLRAGYLF